MKKLIAALSLALLAGGFVQAAATPESVIRDTADTLLQQFSAQRAALQQDKSKLYALVGKVVLPHFDLGKMSRLVLGRHWRTATPTQQKQFMKEFQELLVRTYATALFQYTGEESLNIRPAILSTSGNQAQVKSEFKLNSGAQPATVNYALVKEGGSWKVFDVSVEGVSLVTNYRSAYGEVVQRRGLDALIKSLIDKNAQLQQ